MARHMTELVALLLRDEANDTPPALRDRLCGAGMQLIKAEALKRLGDIDLTIRSLALQVGQTPKQVQRLFGKTGSTSTAKPLSPAYRRNARCAAMRASLQVPASLAWSASRARARAMTAVSRGTHMSATFSSAAAIELGVGW
jgi:hypothetical protein